MFKIPVRRCKVPKQSPIPDALDKPFWDACNEGRLLIQHCKACDLFQHPPQTDCTKCESGANLEWKQVSGRGRIQTYGVVHDSPIALLQADQPYNVAVIELAEDHEVTLLSHLPGIPIDEVPIGTTVEVFFEPTQATGQKVPEWKVVK